MANAEVFGNAAGVILQNSDHPNISNHSILGSAIFQFAPVLATGAVQTGFGIVPSECLGLAPDGSDSLTLPSNLVDRNTNAAIWLCSDGGGLHQIRNNGRGIVLRAARRCTRTSRCSTAVAWRPRLCDPAGQPRHGERGRGGEQRRPSPALT